MDWHEQAHAETNKRLDGLERSVTEVRTGLSKLEGKIQGSTWLAGGLVGLMSALATIILK